MLGLSHDRHTGRLLPHRHTSYGGLALLLAVTGSLALLVTLALGSPSSADSQSGSIGVTAEVAGGPPSSTPVVTTPKSGSTVNSSPITVGGACDPSKDYTVVITSNGAVRGSAFCAHGGSFSLPVSLSPGSNVLASYYVDNLGQGGPVSAPVAVTYQLVEPATPASVGSKSRATALATKGQPTPAVFSVTTPPRFTTVQPGNDFTLTINLAAGAPPFAVQVDWGDGTQNLVSRAGGGTFTVTHAYSKGGHYTIHLRASDATGATSVFQTVLDVGSPAAGSPAARNPAPTGPPKATFPYALTIIWPLFLMVCLVALSFWLGERYSRHRWHLPPAA